MTGDSASLSSLLPITDRAASQPGGEAPASPPGGPHRRRTLLIIGAGVVVAGLAGVGVFALVNNSGGGEQAGSAPGYSVPVRTTAATATPSGSASAAAEVPSGRNPFLLPSSTVAASATASGGTESSSPTGGSAGTPVVTATVAASPLYVGLYGFSGSKAVLWVNDTEYQVTVGDTFAGLTYTAKTSSGCAQVTKGATTTTICAGTVKQLG
jgi:hypothetical protein